MTRLNHPDLYRAMFRIRRFEETVLDSFPRGLFYGTTHTYIGQEANAVGVLTQLHEGDIVVSNHRCHGHFLAYGGSMHALAAELMGRSTGVCAGRGGSQHLQWKDFYANGILGGTIPLAVGMALGEKLSGSSKLVFAFLGDGTMGEGVVYESINMASLWKLPILFIVENNQYAQSTPVHLHLAGEISSRFSAFGVPVVQLNSPDVAEIAGRVDEIANRARSGEGPQALILETYRFAPHSKGDDSRDPEEIAEARKRDPLPLQAKKMERADVELIVAEVESEVSEAFQQAEADPPAAPEDLGITN